MPKELGQNIGKEPELKVVKMPSREDILQRLPKGLVGESSELNDFFNTFIDSVAERELVGSGICMLWELAGYQTLRQCPAVVRVAVSASFDIIVEDITPDPVVAEQAKEFRRSVLEVATKRAKALEPKLEDLGPEDSLEDFGRFSEAMRIGEILQEYTEGSSSEGRSILDQNNPYYRQTHRGFLLEDYYGSPLWLHTPWGEYRLVGEANRFTGDRDEFMRRLGATMSRPEVNNEAGTSGPVYAVHKIDDHELPDPVERPRSEYKSYKDVDESWNILSRQYYESQNQTPPLTIIEKFKLDDAILEARGRKEPLVTDYDIRNLGKLNYYRGKVVKYTRDNGRTWHYTKLGYGGWTQFSDGSIGYSADQEVMPNTKVHVSSALTGDGFDRGMVVRPATLRETRGLKFSYEFENETEKLGTTRLDALFRVVETFGRGANMRVVRVVIPEWDPRKVDISASIIPDDQKANLKPGDRFIAKANLDAKKSKGLKPTEFYPISE